MMLVFAIALAGSTVDQSATPYATQAGAYGAAQEPVSHSEKSVTNRQRIGLWMLEVHHDAFAEQVTCTINAPRMTFDHGALVIRFGATRNTFDAVYRIDGGPRIDTKSDTLDLARFGLPIYQEDLTNASGGLVRIPGDRIGGAQQVRIELSRGGRIYTRYLTGLDKALAAARQNGCVGFSPF